MASHSSTLAWKIPWMEEPGRLQSMGSRRVGHYWATSLSLFTFMHWRRKWQPTPVFLPGETQGRGSWWAAVYGVTQSRTLLKWLSSSSKKKHQSSISLCTKRKGHVRILWEGRCPKARKSGFIKKHWTLPDLDLWFAASRLWERNFCCLSIQPATFWWHSKQTNTLKKLEQLKKNRK